MKKERRFPFSLGALEEKNKKMSTLQGVLTLVFVMALVVSNIISSRTFNFFGFTMTSAVMLFPITYILSDLFSEVYGYRWSRITCYLAFIANLAVVGIFKLVTILPVLPWTTDIVASFEQVLGGVSACTFASFVAFVVGDFANDQIFSRMKKRHKDSMKGFGWRAILSSVAGEFVDSIIYMPLAFLVFNPIMTVTDCIIMIFMQVGLKVGYEIIILPLTTFITKKVTNYESKLDRV